jgi:hypothetical protein
MIHYPLDSEFSVFLANFTVKVDGPMEIIAGHEWVRELCGSCSLENYPVVLSLAPNVPW